MHFIVRKACIDWLDDRMQKELVAPVVKLLVEAEGQIWVEDAFLPFPDLVAINACKGNQHHLHFFVSSSMACELAL